MRCEYARRQDEVMRAGRAVYFFSAAVAFFLASGDCGARLPAPRRGNDALYSRAYFSAEVGQASSLPRAVEGSSGQVTKWDRRVNLGFYMGWWAYLVLGRVFFTHG